MKKQKLLIALILVLVVGVLCVTACDTDPVALAAPQISISDNVVSWTAVPNATSYDVTVGTDKAVNVKGTSFTVNKTDVGNYEISVVAKGDGKNYLDSKPSNKVTYTVFAPAPEQLAAPVISLQGNVVSWTAVANATGYAVTVGTNAAVDVTGTSYTITLEAAGNYDVTVVAKGNGTTHTNSPASNKVTYVIEETPVLTSIALSGDVKTEYFIDEGATELDLTNLVITATLSDGTTTNVDLADVVVGDYDLTEVEEGKMITLTYTLDDETKSTTLFVDVKERTLADIDTYSELLVEYADAGTYALGSNYTAVRTMDGTSILNDGVVTLPMGKTLVSTNNGFVVITVARFISEIAHFKAIANDMDGYYVITKDLDFGNNWQSVLGAAPVVGGAIDQTGVGAEYNANNNNLGVAFTGTLDGQGHTIRNYKIGREEPWWHGDRIGVAMFGYVGATGTICNLNLDNVSVTAGDHAALLVGFNQGTISNVSAQASCQLYSEYKHGAAIVGCNAGKISNVVSHVASLGYNSTYGTDLVVPPIALKADNTEDGTVVNGFVGNDTDLTETLGAGWKYFEAFGTIVATNDFVAIATSQRELAIGTKLYLNTVFANGDAVNVSFYGTHKEDMIFGWDGEKATHYVCINPEADSALAAGDEIVVIFHSTSWSCFYEITIKIAAPVIVDYTNNTQTLSIIEGIDLNLQDIVINANYSDGTTTQINPTRTDFNKNGTVGEAQTVKCYYGEGENDYVEVAITIVAKSITGIAMDSASTHKTAYTEGDELDLNGAKIVVSYDNGTSESVAITADMLDATSYNLAVAGSYNVKVTYQGKDTTFAITVASAAATLQGIAISGTPAKTTFKIDEAVALADLAGATIVATYSDESTTNPAIALDMLTYDFSTAGTKQITVTFEGKTATIEVTVVDYAVALVATPASTTLAYSRTTALDLVAAATYELTMKSGATQMVSGVTASQGKPGKVTVTYTYSDDYATVTDDVVYDIWYEVKGDDHDTSMAEWNFMQANLDGYFRLVQDMDFGGAYIRPLARQIVYVAGEETTVNPLANGAVAQNEGSKFTGIFDGQWYSMKWFYMHHANLVGNAFDDENFGLSLFGHVGATGVVKNFYVHSSKVASTNHTGLIATVNEGTIENIIIQETRMELGARWKTAAIIMINMEGAVAKNLVCELTTCRNDDLAVDSATTFATAIHTNYGTATNCAVKGTEAYNALTADALNDACTNEADKKWAVVDGVGPVYGNYAVITSYDATVAIGGTWNFTIATNLPVGFVYVRDDIYPDLTVVDAEAGTYSVYIDPAKFIEAREYTFGVNVTGIGYVTVTVTVTAAEAQESL